MKRFAFAGLVGALAAAGAAQAATSSGTFQVTASVLDTCTVSADDLNFGVYNPLSGSALEASSQLHVACTIATPYSVALNAGTAPGATVSSRKMVKASDVLSYSLFRDPTRLLSWGQTVGIDTVIGIGTGLTTPISVYGRVPVSQNVPPGSYSDTVTVTVMY